MEDIGLMEAIRVRLKGGGTSTGNPGVYWRQEPPKGGRNLRKAQFECCYLHRMSLENCILDTP